MRTCTTNFTKLFLFVVVGLAWFPIVSHATERVSVDAEGNESNGGGSDPAISRDGRFVVFESHATDLITGDTNGVQDLYAKDRQTGAIKRVSLTSMNGESNQDSDNQSISGDGSVIAFECYASNMIALDPDGNADIYVYNETLDQLEIVSISEAGLKGNGDSTDPSISNDGRYVAFESNATNLVADDTNGRTDIFVYDRHDNTIERVSIKDLNTEANHHSRNAAISGDGRYVAFSSKASNLVDGDTNGRDDIFVHDRVSGTITRVSISSGGSEADNGSNSPAVSSDGRFVAFQSSATNLVSGDTNATEDIFLKDLETGNLVRCSVDDSGIEGNGYSQDAALSADGRFIAFKSYATNLVAGDTNVAGDIFVHDRIARETRRISVDDSGTEADGESFFPEISGDGRVVAFQSNATNLVNGDLNNRSDIFTNGNPLFYQMINSVGKTAGTSTRKLLRLKARKGRAVRGVLKIRNNANSSDMAAVKGGSGNRLFTVTYSSSAGNITGAFTSGSYTTPELNAGDSHFVSLVITPKKSKLQKKKRRAGRRIVKWLRKSYTLSLTSSSMADTTKIDTATVKVLHR
ncbi:MAG: hypothetical protein P1U87_13770 [Verrucomicrobiales bacterium]|nr:hypothetical protein [Verrucomicrobiales bacterium]